MTTKLRLMALALVVALFSVQCTKDDAGAPNLPTTIDSYFDHGEFSYEGVNIPYRDAITTNNSNGKAPLLVVLHGQNASGTDNIIQLRTSAMLSIWHYFTSNNIKATILAPQCSSRRAWDEKSGDVKGATMSQALKAMIDDYVSKNSNVDTSKIYIVGYSDGAQPAGAGGVWQMLNSYTETFAAAMVVAADPDDSISPKSVAKTPVLSIRCETDVYAVALTLGAFGDLVRDAGGVLEEKVMHTRSREDICRDAFSAENLDWLLQYTR